MYYNIALILCLHREASQRELYNDAQHRKILNRSRYEYRSQSLVHSGGYIYLRITYTRQFGSPRRSGRPSSYITGRQRYAHIPVPKLRQQATPGYIHFSSHTHMCYTPTSHTTESHRRRNFSPRNCQAFPIKTTRQ